METQTCRKSLDDIAPPPLRAWHLIHRAATHTDVISQPGEQMQSRTGMRNVKCQVSHALYEPFVFVLFFVFLLPDEWYVVIIVMNCVLNHTLPEVGFSFVRIFDFHVV